MKGLAERQETTPYLRTPFVIYEEHYKTAGVLLFARSFMTFLISVFHFGLIHVFNGNGLQISNLQSILPAFKKQMLLILLVKQITLIFS